MNEYFNIMRRCTRCILPETFPGIEFDENGVCNYCTSYKPVNVFGEEEFKRVLSSYRNKGKKYDCIVPVSGGRDSAFVLHQIVIKYKIRAIAVMIDIGDHTPEAIQNIKRMAEILNVDYMVLKDEKAIENSKQNLKKNLHTWLKNPSINLIIPIITLGDKTMNWRLYEYAEKNKIPLIIGGTVVGSSSFEQEHFKTGYLGVFPDERGIYSTYDKIKLAILFGYEYLKNPYYFHWSSFKEGLKGFYVYFFANLLKPKNVHMIGFFDYIYWNEKEILATIIEDLNWKGVSDTTTTWRVHDKSSALYNYLYCKLVGFTEHDEMYSKMIRENQISRSESLERCISDHKPRIPSLMNIFKELEVNKEQMDEVLEKYRVKLLIQINKVV
jgi:glucosamine--fructose-6-phosphate aminotransferase (isomerizing)